MRGRNLVQMLLAVELLGRPGGATLAELGEKLGIGRRAVYRLLELIEEMGFPLYDEKVPLERAKRWTLEPGFVKKLPNLSIPEVALTGAELLALHFLRAAAAFANGTDLERHLDAAFEKIGQAAPRDLYQRLRRIKTLFVSVDNFAKDYSGKENIIDELAQAMLTLHTCRVTYDSFSSGETKVFRIDPLTFFEKDGGLYLFVRVTRFGDIRMLAVERILDLEVLPATFCSPEDFDPEALLGQAFGLVYDDPVEATIHIAADQVRYVLERKLFQEQTVHKNADGSIILDLRTSGWWDVKRFVLSLGESAEVITPEAMREELKHEFQTLYHRYRKRS